MMALKPHLSLVTKWIVSWSSKSGKPQGVVISALQLGCEKMGRSRGLEPPTPGTTNQCSNQLSYDRHGACRERLPRPRAALRVQARGTQAVSLSKDRVGPSKLGRQSRDKCMLYFSSCEPCACRSGGASF